MKDKKDEKVFIANTAEEVKMIFDPYRFKILRELHHNKKEMTVKQIAVKLGEAPNKVHYHVKKLFNFGVLELVRTENINGIIAKYYNSTYSGYMIGTEGKSKEVLNVKQKAIMTTLDDIVSQFKVDMVSYMNLVSEQGKQAQRGMHIGYMELYMTKEEKEDFVDQMTQLIEKYTEKVENKEVYTSIQTLARIK